MTMTTNKTRRRVTVLAGLAAVAIFAASCGDDDNGNGNGNGASPSPTSTGPVGGGQQPIIVPTIDEPNLTPQAAQQLITDEVMEQCGGELCVTVSIEESEDDAETCQFVGTEPDEGQAVQRGGEIVIVAGTQPCTTSTPSPGATGTASPSPGGSPTASPTASPTGSPTASPTASPTG